MIGKCSNFLVDCFWGCLNDDSVHYDSGSDVDLDLDSDFGSDSDSCFGFDFDFPPLFLVDRWQVPLDCDLCVALGLQVLFLQIWAVILVLQDPEGTFPSLDS